MVDGNQGSALKTSERELHTLESSAFSRRTFSPTSSLILSTRFQDGEIGHNIHLVKRVERDDARCRVCACHA